MAMVRAAREDEIPALTAIGFAAWERAVSGLADADGMRRVAELAFLSFLGNNWQGVTVVEHEGFAVGWAAREDGDGTISDLWIEPACQRGGLGSLLLSAVEEDIRLGGFDAASVRTHAQNAQAIGFFRKHGYSVNWLSTAYSAKLDKDVDSIGMTKALVDLVPQAHQQWL